MATQRQPDGFFPNIFAGAVAGGVACCAVAPLEVIKTRLQSTTLYGTFSKSAGVKAGVTRCFKDAVKLEGGRALYKGLGATLVGVIPSRAIYFGVYTKGKQLLDNGSRSPFKVHVYASAITGVANVTWSNPLFVVRTRQQLQVDTKDRRMLSFWNCAKATYAQDGFRGFLRGISASYMGIAETVVALVLWEHFKKSLSDNEEGPGPLKSGLAAAGAKFIATTTCYSHEVLRTRLRETAGPNRKYKTLVQSFSLIYSEEGARGLYRGFVPQLFRVVPNHAIMFVTFEAIISLLKYYNTSKLLYS